MNQTNKLDFLASLLEIESYSGINVDDCLNWIYKQRESVTIEVIKVPFTELKEWHFNQDTGNLHHNSGKFFSIEGISVKTNIGFKQHWQQPIINQPEIGFLGIITKKINGVLHFLLQAKIEPGNINFVQLSPTLQATKSNYTQVHGGNKPAYLDYFTGLSMINTKVLIDQLQSEQGARFLRKRNRNIIIEVFEDIPLLDNFIWLTLGQIKALLKFDNVVNMDTRTVISSISYGSFIKDSELTNSSNLDKLMLGSAMDLNKAHFDFDHHIAWLTNLKSSYDLTVESIGMKFLNEWKKNDFEIFHQNKKYFTITAVQVIISNREVSSWTQPIIESAQEGIIGFILKEINGVYHFLVQAKLESGNFDILELAPTVQCLTGNYRKGSNEYEVPFLDLFLTAKPEQIIHKSLQSEEGGRFYREQNLNIIIKVGEDFSSDKIPENFTWMTLAQLMEFIKFNNYLNIQARSLLSCISFGNTNLHSNLNDKKN